MSETEGEHRERPGDGRGSAGPSGRAPFQRSRRARLARLALWILLGATLFLWFRGTGAEGRSIPYTTFRAQLDSGNVAAVTVRGDRIRGTLVSPVPAVTEEGDTVRWERFVTVVPAFGDDALLADLREQGVEVRAVSDSGVSWWTILFAALPILFLLALGWAAMRRMGGRAGGRLFSIGKSRAKLYQRTEEATTFQDVAGLEGAKRELGEIVAYLKEPARFQRLGGEAPKGVLLVGPPGTGKTLLARAVAGEADVPFFSISGSDFMEMFVGVGASRVRDLFAKAKAQAPSIIFVDELDSIGRRRGAGLGGGHDEREQTLNQLLSELDGFEPTENVIVMAASNRPDILDPALLRPGRFDRRITVDLPTAADREDILRLHARRKPLAPDVDLERLARATPGLSGADLANLLNESALTAARKDKKRIDRQDVEEARDRVLMGLERESLGLDEDEVNLLAYHEAGHAVVAAVLPDTDPVHKVTIVPRGRAMGVTQQLPEKEKVLYERGWLLDRLAVIMGGRAAEALVFDTATSGAQNDLREAAKLARKMVLDWGMSERLGTLVSTGRREEVFLGREIAEQREFSDETARLVDEEVRRIVDGAFERARSTLEEHRDALDRVAARLREDEELEGSEVEAIVGVGERG